MMLRNVLCQQLWIVFSHTHHKFPFSLQKQTNQIVHLEYEGACHP